MTKFRKALLACARWQQLCLELGWPRSYLDRLEALWWEYHDDNGRLLMGPGVRTRSSQ